MATALRPAPVSLLDLQADEPEGSVPAPFPIFEVRRSVDQMPRDRRLQEPAQSATAPELASEPVGVSFFLSSRLRLMLWMTAS